MNQTNLKIEINQALMLLNRSKDRMKKSSRKYKMLKIIEEMLKEQVQK